MGKTSGESSMELLKEAVRLSEQADNYMDRGDYKKAELCYCEAVKIRVRYWEKNTLKQRRAITI